MPWILLSMWTCDDRVGRGREASPKFVVSGFGGTADDHKGS
jgi:hypothetical protein